MDCDVGRLQAWLDETLEGAAAAEVAAHVAGCPDCRARRARMERDHALVGTALASLEPVGPELSPVDASLPRVRARARAAKHNPMGRLVMSLSKWFPPAVRRPVLVGVLTVATVALLLTLAPARQAAAQFLQLFRVNTFAIVPVTEERMQDLQGLEGLLESGLMGEPTMVREPGPRQSAANAAEASTLAGYHVREATYLPAGLVLDGTFVQAGPAIRVETERATMQSLLDQAGIEDVALPPLERMTVGVDLPIGVVQQYRGGGGDQMPAVVRVFQMPQPRVEMPEGVDPALLGESLLQLLGVPADEAARLARAIDWTSTLVIPVPGFLRFREVVVNGMPAVLLGDSEYEDGGRSPAVLWQKDGIVYGVVSQGITDGELLRIADSLR